MARNDWRSRSSVRCPADVDCGRIVVARCKRGTHRRVHSSTEENDGPGFGHVRHPSNSLNRGIPNKFVQLKAEPGRNVVGDHPFCQFLGIEKAMGTVAGAGRILTERWRKKYGVDR